MSGRSGYRKTERRVINRRAPAQMPLKRMIFTLPPNLAWSVPAGAHGGVVVNTAGLVEATGKSRDDICTAVASFLRKIGKNGPDFSVTALFEAPAESGKPNSGYRDTYHLTVATGNPAVVVSRTSIEPAVFVR